MKICLTVIFYAEIYLIVRGLI